MNDDGSPPDPDLGVPAAPPDFALRILRRAGIAREHYDTYVRLDTAAGGLYTAFGTEFVTGSVLATGGMTAGRFEELHRRRTGRSAIETTRPFPGLATALRTGRTRHLPLDPAARGDREARVLDAVRGISPGQLRPLSWVAREAGLPDGPGVERLAGVLAANPFTVLVPCHRVTYEDGAPCDAAYRPADGDALRRAEGLDMTEVRAFARSGAVLLGSDTTRIFCYPTCAHARRITAPHRVPFTGPRDADLAGYRACKSCRPVSV